MNLLGKLILTRYDDDPPVDPPVDPPLDPPGKKTFTQDEVNAFLAEDRRRHQAQTQKTVQELEAIKKAKGLTEKEKTDLQARIDELSASLLTKEQLAQKEKEKLTNQHQQAVQSLTSERDTWQNRFVSSTINQVITSEAVKAEAFDPEGLIAILGPSTRLIEQKDEEGNGTNQFVPMVKFNDTDKEGKSITLELTVEQAIKRMKEITRFGYLFKTTASGGLGTNQGAGKAKPVDLKNMSAEQYREWRQKQGMGKKQ